MKSVQSIVRQLVARYLHRDVSSIQPWQTLDEELGLTPLTVALITLDLEDIEQVSISIDDLSRVQTIGELEDFFASSVASSHRRAFERVA